MERRITQETFDSVVSENIADFDMGPKEALADAIEQFTSQKVDLTAIDVSGGIGREEFNTAFHGLRDRTGDAAEHMRALRMLCVESYEFSTRNKNLLVVSAGISVIMDYLGTEETPEVSRECMELLVVVCKNMGE
jgi:hypothetical protein